MEEKTRWVVTLKPGETRTSRSGVSITNNEDRRVNVTITTPIINNTQNADGSTAAGQENDKVQI